MMNSRTPCSPRPGAAAKKTPKSRRAATGTTLATGLLLAASCQLGDARDLTAPPAAPAVEGPLASVRAALAGQDGDVTVTLPSTVLNSYSTLAMPAAKGDKSLTVSSAADLKDPRTGMALKQGDLLMLYQAQGATIDTSNDAKKFGAVTALNGAGKFEFVLVESVTGNIVVVGGGCSGLQNAYPTAGKTQVLRVPQLNSLKINAGASVVAKTWDGSTGGVVAVHVLRDTQLDGAIDVTAQGFRGGRVDAMSNPISDPKVTTMASKDPAQGAEQGEGIAGSQDDYQAAVGKYGRGAPANGGGGGNAHNAAGGGGANGGDILKWTGHGVMDKAVLGGMSAWPLDPAYKDNGNAYTTSSGGGRGGYSTSRPMMMGIADPTVDAPGDAKWSGNNRQDVGGLGGHPLRPTPGFELFMGGGGGAGDQDNNSGGNGGNGGGVVILVSGTVTVPMGSSGQISANGGDGADTGNGHNDAAGGGGGGGSIFLLTGKAIDASVQLSANGGYGGNQKRAPSDTLEAEGPGGGGGGGTIVYMAGGKPMVSAKGQLGGTTVASTMSKFPSNGATNGDDGLAIESPRQPMVMGMPANYPICMPSDIQVTVMPPAGMVQPGSNAEYTVTVKNVGDNPALGTDILTTLPSGTDPSKVTWTCTPTGVGVMCPGGMTSGMGPLPSQADLPKDGSLQFKVSLPVPPPTPNPTLDLGVAAYPPPGYTDPLLTNNRATGKAPIAGGTTTPKNSDLQVSVTKSPQTPNPGDETTVTISAKNNGPDGAGKPVVVFSIPAGSTVTQPPPKPGDPGAWSCVASGTLYTCTMNMDLPAGMSAPDLVVKFRTPSDPSAGTPQVPVLIGSPNTSDPNPGNNRAVVDVGPTQPQKSADLALTIGKSPSSSGPGMDTTFNLEAKNLGPDATANPAITFTIPPGSRVTQEPAGLGWACSRSDTTVTCIAPRIASGQTLPPVSIGLNAPVPMAGASPGVVAGSVSAPGSRDPNPQNNQDQKPIAASVQPTGSDLGIRITTDKPNPQPGDEITYTGVASNRGPDAVSSPVVTIQLPAGATITQPAQGDGWSCTQSGSTAVCTRDSIATGEAPPITVKVKLPSDSGSGTQPGSGTPTTSAVVGAAGNQDPNPNNNSAVVDVRPTQPRSSADLALAISKTPSSGGTGTEVTYTIEGSNQGPGTVASPSITLTIPPGSTVVQPPQGQGWNCIRSGASFTCYLDGSLPPGAASPITLKLNTPAPGDPSQGAGAVAGVISAPSNDDPLPLNNQASTPVSPTPTSGSDLSVKIRQTPGGAKPGDSVVYTADVSNAGPDAVSNPVVTISLPPGAEVTDGPSGDGWSCARDAGTVICTRDKVASGSAPPISVTVKLPSSTSGAGGNAGSAQPPIAKATVNAPSNNDPNLANNIAASDLYRLFGGGLGCSASGRAPQSSDAAMAFVGTGLALLLGLRRRRLVA